MPKTFTCIRCGYCWSPYVSKPGHCPHCKSPYWNTRYKRSDKVLKPGDRQADIFGPPDKYLGLSK